MNGGEDAAHQRDDDSEERGSRHAGTADSSCKDRISSHQSAPSQALESKTFPGGSGVQALADGGGAQRYYRTTSLSLALTVDDAVSWTQQLVVVRGIPLRVRRDLAVRNQSWSELHVQIGHLAHDDPL